MYILLLVPRIIITPFIILARKRRAKKEEAEAAVRALNGQEFGGRSLTVNEARERSERPREGGGRGGGYGNRF